MYKLRFFKPFTIQKRCHSTHIKYPFEVKEFWSKNEKLLLKRKNEDILFVFLEGYPGSGKIDTLNRLNKIGYSVYNNSFIQLGVKNHYNFQYKPDGKVNQLQYMEGITRFMESCKMEQITNLKSHKDGIVFMNRSPLSSWTCANDSSGLTIMKEISESFNTSTIYCHSDELKIMERLGGRMFLSKGGEQYVREVLKEDKDDVQEAIRSRYKVLQDEGFFDDIVYTTDVKQAQAQILKIFGLNNWEAFKAMHGK